VAEVPLLYETGRAAEFDRVVVAACSRAEQMRRLQVRDRLAPDEAERRLSAQLPIEEKRDRADFVVDTSATTAETERQIVDIWERLTAEVSET
jgi:dephospho-CoA kinase